MAVATFAELLSVFAHPLRAGYPPPASAAGAALAALAALGLAPSGDRKERRLRRIWGAMAACALLALGASHWLQAAGRIPLSGTAAFCFLLLGFSLLAKPRLPSLSVTADMLVAFVGYAMVLDYLVQAPAVTHPPATGVALNLSTAAALFVASGAWMAMWPERRPVSFFVETGSAGAVLRRLLPITLLYPALLVLLNTLRSHAHPTAARITEIVVVYGTVLFGVVLFWLIARLLDRRDALSRNSERELRASEQRYRLLFEESQQPMWIFSVDSLRFLAVNDSAVARFGYSREEFLRMKILDVRPEEDAPALLAELRSGAPARGRRWRYRTKAGAELTVDVYAHRIEWEGGPAFISFLHDMTDRIAAEYRLRESEAQVRMLLESTSEGIYAVDLEGSCIWANPAAARLLGVEDARALLGRNMHAQMHHTRADGTPYPLSECVMMAATRAGETLRAEEELVWRADGSSFPADYQSAPIRQEGTLAGAVVSFTDVSERQNLRAQFHQAQKMEAVGRLAAGIAHDFNNLLTVVNGYCDILLAHPDDPAASAKIGTIRKAGDRAASLTQQLLAFSRQQVLQPRVLDMNAVVSDMEPLLRRVMGEDVSLVTMPGPSLGAVRADPGQLSQVLMNLVVNARDAMPKGGQVTVETENVILDEYYAAKHPEVVPGPYVMLAVTDTGSGMAEETQRHLFEPFFTTKPAGKGTGLGLATVFGIVKQSGGSIGVYSELGHGTAMKIYLPRQVETAEETEERQIPPRVERGRETILLVEDEAAVRELVAEVLRDQGYEVLAAGHPSEALELAAQRREPLDLLISDVVLPDCDGRALLKELQQQQPTLQVLFISGFPDQAIARHGQLDAGLAFLQKPFTPESLARKVREVLESKLDARAAIIQPQP
ncbi:MAG TPA: PAS domain S-box protein [Terriglobales bacterium]|nr:PAS domain S-box protein [Terriglobales bacterium]